MIKKNHSLLKKWKEFKEKNNFVSKKSLGQHFLYNMDITKKIVEYSGNYENIVEIGPGYGILTEQILTKNFKTLKLVEYDEIICRFLNENFVDNKISIINTDALKFDSFEPNTEIISNLPYNISKRLIIQWLNNPNIQQITIMLQKEVAESLVAKPNTKDYKMISVLVQIFFDPKICFHLSSGNFNPAPTVNSSIIQLKRKFFCDNVLLKKFMNLLELCFAHRRKKISNVLPRELISHLDGNIRPDTIEPHEFWKLIKEKK